MNIFFFSGELFKVNKNSEPLKIIPFKTTKRHEYLFVRIVLSQYYFRFILFIFLFFWELFFIYISSHINFFRRRHILILFKNNKNK